MGTMNLLAVEALCSATYMENYLDCMETLPTEIQRNVSYLRELDSKSAECLKDIANNQDAYLSSPESNLKKAYLVQIQRALIKCQEIGDEKLQVVSQINEYIETRGKQLQQDLENLDPGTTLGLTKKREEKPMKASLLHSPPLASEPRPSPQPQATDTASIPTTSASNLTDKQPVQKTEKAAKAAAKRQRRQKQDAQKEEEKKQDDDKPKKKKKRKIKKEKEDDKARIIGPIDPDEPTYCLCDQVSYGEMIGCDNEDCVVEWFHFNCVSLTHKPKGKWFCPTCRGDKPNVRKQDK